jgi:hypothetical protein
MFHKPEEHHQYALQRYGNVLRGVRMVISARKDSMRIALIASLLIFCFENFHGDVQNAIGNVKSAVEFMYSWPEKQSQSPEFRGFSPAPIVVEDELVVAFFRLARYMILFHGRIEDTYPKAKRSLDPFAHFSPTRDRNPNNATSPVLSMPSVFKSIAEAKLYWDPILELANEYLYAVRTANTTPSEPGQRAALDNLFPERTMMVEEIQQWSTAFAPILEQSRTPAGDEQFGSATT